MDSRTELTKDERTIKSVWFLNEGGGGYEVGDRFGTTKITAYAESGHMAMIPWIAIWKGNEISVRVTAEAVIIHYAPVSDAF